MPWEDCMTVIDPTPTLVERLSNIKHTSNKSTMEPGDARLKHPKCSGGGWWIWTKMTTSDKEHVLFSLTSTIKLPLGRWQLASEVAIWCVTAGPFSPQYKGRFGWPGFFFFYPWVIRGVSAWPELGFCWDIWGGLDHFKAKRPVNSPKVSVARQCCLGQHRNKSPFLFFCWENWSIPTRLSLPPGWARTSFHVCVKELVVAITAFYWHQVE